MYNIQSGNILSETFVVLGFESEIFKLYFCFAQVRYAQTQINEVTQKLMKGTNYVATKSSEAKNLVVENYPAIKTKAEQTVAEGTNLLAKKWDNIYSTTMYIPNKALQVTGEVYISAQEIVFAYTKVS